MDADTRATNRMLVFVGSWVLVLAGAALVLAATDQPLLDGRKVLGLILAAAGVLGVWRVGVDGGTR